ncbi:unnamed protein product [Discula destructiva]
MTKDWQKYKAFIENLYMVQGKTLEETKKIMKADHGFAASTRTYRTHFNDWEWHKYTKKRKAHEPAPVTSVGLNQSHGALLMTPESSSQGTAGPLMTSVVSDSHTPACSSLEKPYSYDPRPVAHGNRIVSSSSLTATAFSEIHNIHETYMPQNLPDSQLQRQPPLPRDSGVFARHAYGYDQRIQHAQQPQQLQQQQYQQQQMPLRPIQPAPQHRSPQILPINTGGVPFPALISPTSPPLLSTHRQQNVNLNMNSMHGYAEPSGADGDAFVTSGHHLTDFEHHVYRPSVYQLSAQDTYDFCRECVTFVRQGADTTRIVPQGLDQVIIQATAQFGSTAIGIHNAVSYYQHQHQHQQRQQEEQQHGTRGPTVQPWVAIWVSACQQSLYGSFEEPLRALSVLLAEQIDVSRVLRPLLSARYATPGSASCR